MQIKEIKFKGRGKNGKYLSLILPKKMIEGLGWKQEDILRIRVFDKSLITIQKIIDKNYLDSFDKVTYKKLFRHLSRIGGQYGSLGLRSIPRELIDILKIQHNQPIFLVNGENTTLSHPNLIIACTKKNKLDLYKPLNQTDKNLIMYKKRLKDRYNLKLSIDAEDVGITSPKSPDTTKLKVWTTGKIIDNYLKRVEGHENIEKFSFKEWVPIEEVARIKAELAEKDKTILFWKNQNRHALTDKLKERLSKSIPKVELQKIIEDKDNTIFDIIKEIRELLSSEGKEVRDI